MLWALFTLLAAAGQTARNALQRDLTARLGTVGATHVRFLFGLPFGLTFLVLMTTLTGEPVLLPDARGWLDTALGAFAQILATALMLAAMRDASFVAATAYTKTEPVLVALFGLLVLGERLTTGMALAIGLATSGVMLTAWPKSRAAMTDLKAVGLGLAAAAGFAVSAIEYRAAIIGLPAGGFAIRASTILALGLSMQAGALTLWLAATDRPVLRAILANWRPSLAAGFMGALASQFWFFGFALTSAARVRTLALVEVLFARIVSGRLFREVPDAREGLGLLLIVAGVALILNV